MVPSSFRIRRGAALAALAFLLTGAAARGAEEATPADHERRIQELEETIRRLTAYAEAGADCLFAPGIRTADEIRAVVTAVAPKPVNVLVASDFTTVLALAELGVRRISVGGALARAAWTGFLAAAREIQEQGTFASFGRATPGLDINRLFAPR